MKSTRNLIRRYLKRHRSATAFELSRSLGLTAADVRYHLKQMLATGEVETAQAHTANRRGRPAQVFRLAQSHRPNALPRLSGVLLDHFAAQGGSPSDLAAAFLPVPETDAPVTHRLNQLVQTLNCHHYDARWEARAAGPQVIFANCPYAQIVSEHPELCQMDLNILELWSQLTVDQVARFNPQTKNPRHCVFRLHEKPVEN